MKEGKGLKTDTGVVLTQSNEVLETDTKTDDDDRVGASGESLYEAIPSQIFKLLLRARPFMYYFQIFSWVSWVHGHMGCPEIFGPRSHLDHKVHFMKFCKMLFVLLIAM